MRVVYPLSDLVCKPSKKFYRVTIDKLAGARYKVKTIKLLRGGKIMKVEFNKKELQKRVSAVAGIVASQSSLTIGEYILLRSSGKENQTFVAATDLETTIVSYFSETENPGADFDALVPAHKFLSILKEINAETVEIEFHKDTMEIIIPSASFKFPCRPGKDFPKIPAMKMKSVENPDEDFATIMGLTMEGGIPIAACDIAENLKNLLRFCSTEEGRRNLHGVCFEQLEGKIRMVASDSYRLSYFEREIGTMHGADSVVISKKAVSEIIKSVKNEAEDFRPGGDCAEFVIEKEQIISKIGNTIIITKPVTWDFPDYKKIIKDIFSGTPVIINSKTMMGAVRRIGVFTKESHMFQMVTTADKVTISVTDADEDEGKETFSLEFPASEIKNFKKNCYDPRFFEDALIFLNGETIELRPAGEESPAVCTLPKRKDMVCVIMPRFG